MNYPPCDFVRGPSANLRFLNDRSILLCIAGRRSWRGSRICRLRCGYKSERRRNGGHTESLMRFYRGLRIVLSVVLLFSGLGFVAEAVTPIPANHIRIHYFRPDGAYAGWTVYAFGDTTEDQGNYGGGPVQIAGTDSFGVFFDVGVTSGAKNVGIIIHNSCCKDPGPNEYVKPSAQGHEVWA